MKKSFLTSITLTVFLSLALTVLPGYGSKEKAEENAPAPADSAAAQQEEARRMAEAFFSDEIRSLPAEELAALGAKNDLPTMWIYPNAFSAKLIHPIRFLQSENADAVIRFLGNSPNLLPFWDQFEKIELMMISDKIASVSLLDPQDDKVIGEHYPLAARATYIRKNAPVDQDGVRNSFFGTVPREQVLETRIGDFPVTMVEETMMIPMDQSGKNHAKINGVVTAIHYPSETEVLIVNGPRSAVEGFFTVSDGDQRGVLAQRIGRTDAERFDFTFLYDYQSPQKQAISLPFPTELAGELLKDADSLRFTINSRADDGEDALTLEITANEGTDALDEALGSALLQLDETLQKAPTLPEGEKAQGGFAQYLQELSGVLQTITKEKSDGRLTASIKNSPELVTLAGHLIETANHFSEESVKNDRRSLAAQNLAALGQLINNAYYPKNNHFPPMAITAEDGTPLLSWRVALLPAMGPEGEALYQEFKLDQPWDGPDNIKLLDRMPVIYRSPLTPSETKKTTFQIFTRPDTPFGKSNAPLKIQDFENPGKTFMIVSVEGDKAIEWTRPDELTFSEETLGDVFGDFILAVPVMGEIFTAPYSGSADEVKALSDWIYGRAETETEEEVPAPPAENPLDSDTPAQ